MFFKCIPLLVLEQGSCDPGCTYSRVSSLHHQGFHPGHRLLRLWDRPSHAHTGTGLRPVCVPPLAGRRKPAFPPVEQNTERFPPTIVMQITEVGQLRSIVLITNFNHVYISRDIFLLIDHLALQKFLPKWGTFSPSCWLFFLGFFSHRYEHNFTLK